MQKSIPKSRVSHTGQEANAKRFYLLLYSIAIRTLSHSPLETEY